MRVQKLYIPLLVELFGFIDTMDKITPFLSEHKKHIMYGAVVVAVVLVAWFAARRLGFRYMQSKVVPMPQMANNVNSGYTSIDVATSGGFSANGLKDAQAMVIDQTQAGLPKGRPDEQLFIGSYVPEEDYGLAPMTGRDVIGPGNALQPADPRLTNLPIPAGAPFAKGVDYSMFAPRNDQLSADGQFEDVLIDPPRDLLWQDNLSESATFLTNNFNQSHDLRGDIEIGALNLGGEVGPFGGINQSTHGPYERMKPLRQYVA